jgi:hypothetical protein
VNGSTIKVTRALNGVSYDLRHNDPVVADTSHVKLGLDGANWLVGAILSHRLMFLNVYYH